MTHQESIDSIPHIVDIPVVNGIVCTRPGQEFFRSVASFVAQGVGGPPKEGTRRSYFADVPYP
jgi:hypothetical protein